MAKMFIQSFVLILCTIGCIYQTLDILQLYLSYKMVTNLKVEYPTKLNPPDLNMCINFGTIFNLDLFLKGRKTNWSPYLMVNEDIPYNMTIKDIFDYTISDSNITFKDCLIRPPNAYDYLLIDGEQCKQYFTI